MASSYVQKVIRSVKKSNPHQPEFIQALEEVLHSLEPLFLKDPSTSRTAFSNASSNPNARSCSAWHGRTTRAACR